MKVFKVSGCYWDKGGVAHEIKAYVFIKRWRRGDRYEYALKDDFDPKELTKTACAESDIKDWSEVAYRYFVDKYELNFGPLSVEKIRL